MVRHAIILAGVVENIALWDGETDWTPPAGASVVALADGDACDIGWSYDGTVLSPPGAPALADVKAAKLADMQALKAQALAAMTYALGGVAYRVTLGVQDQVDVQLRLQELAAEPPGTTTNWEIVNNVFLDLTLQDLDAIFVAGKAYITAVYAWAKSMAAGIGAMITVDAVQGLDLTAGLPA